MFPLKQPEDDQSSSTLFHMAVLLGFAWYFGQLGRNTFARCPLGNCVDSRLKRWSHGWLPSRELNQGQSVTDGVIRGAVYSRDQNWSHPYW